jgi:streptogramin lyase
VRVEADPTVARSRRGAARHARRALLIVGCACVALLAGAESAPAAPAGQAIEFTAGLNSSSFAIAPGPDGNLWFTDQGTTGAIGRITPAGAITEFTAGLNPGSAPWGIAPGPDGTVWFTDQGTTRAIGRISPGGGTITEFTAGLTAGTIPAGIAPGPDGNLWFAEFGNADDAIGRITLSGAIAEFSLSAGSNPVGIAPGADGNLWFTNPMATQFSISAIGRISPGGAIAVFNDGLNFGSVPVGIAPGADGNLWFADLGGETFGIGRIGAGASAASLRAPSVTGSGEQGTQQVCQGDRWATWAGQQPVQNSPASSPPGVQWLRDGAPLAGETDQTYTPVAGDVGHLLACTVAVTYPLLNVTTSATSDDVTVIPQATGPSGPQGPAGPQGSPGRDATVTCKTKGKKVKCKVAFSSAAGVRKARLSRNGVTYAEGKPVAAGGKLVLRFRSQRRLEPGRYTLAVVQHLDGNRVVTKSAVWVR